MFPHMFIDECRILPLLNTINYNDIRWRTTLKTYYILSLKAYVPFITLHILRLSIIFFDTRNIFYIYPKHSKSYITLKKIPIRSSKKKTFIEITFTAQNRFLGSHPFRTTRPSFAERIYSSTPPQPPKTCEKTHPIHKTYTFSIVPFNLLSDAYSASENWTHQPALCRRSPSFGIADSRDGVRTGIVDSRDGVRTGIGSSTRIESDAGWEGMASSNGGQF